MKILLIFLIIFSAFHTPAQTTLVWDQEYYSNLISLLDNAKHSVKIISFSFAIDDGKGNYQINSNSYRIASKLIDLKKSLGNNIDISIYLEGERNTSNRNKITGDLLSMNGISVKYGSTHAKGFIIDNQKLLFGSTNLTNQSINKNNETNILTDDQIAIEQFNKFFDNLISDGKFGSINLDSPLIADGEYKNAIIKSINQATTSIEFSIYYFNDLDIENALIAAFKRGVSIKGYLNSLDVPGSQLVEKNLETIKRMNTQGISDLHLALDNSFTHSKFIVFDQKHFLLGTGNWNYSDYSMYRQIYFICKDVQLSKKLSEHLSTQIATESK